MAVGNFEIADLLVGTVCPEHGYLARSTEAPAVVGGDEFFAPEADLQRGGSIDSRSEQPASQFPLLLSQRLTCRGEAPATPG